LADGSGADRFVRMGVGPDVGLGLALGVRSGEGLVHGVGLADGLRTPGMKFVTGAADGALVGVQVIVLELFEETTGFCLDGK